MEEITIVFNRPDNCKRTKGFTLLELIIVIIIVAVLASLALPRFFKAVEYSRSVEALANIVSLRQAIERCYLMNTGDLTACTGGAGFGVWNNRLMLEDPSLSPNSHFDYGIGYYASPPSFTVIAHRNTRDHGNTYDEIRYSFPMDNTSSAVKCGQGTFQPIGNQSCY